MRGGQAKFYKFSRICPLRRVKYYNRHQITGGEMVFDELMGALA